MGSTVNRLIRETVFGREAALDNCKSWLTMVFGIMVEGQSIKVESLWVLKITDGGVVS